MSWSATRLNSLVTGAALVLLASLLAWISVRYTYQADWTRNSRHSLSEASLQLLDKLEHPVEITVYAREQEALREAVRKFIGRYQRYGADFKLHFINPDVVPDETRILGIRVNGEMVIRYQGRVEHVRSGKEEEFSNALQRLLRGTERWLAFVEGHGERNPTGTANHDLNEWAAQLLGRGFKYQPLNLAVTRTIPDNTSVLVISAPLVPWLRWETELVLDYLRNGGNLLWLWEPGELYGLESIAAYLGLEFRAGTVIDAAAPQAGIDDPTITMLTAADYPEHPVLEQFSFTTVFPQATTIDHTGSDDWDITPLLRTGSHTWQETGTLEGRIFLDAGIDIPGPLHLALGLERNIELPGVSGPVIRQQRIIVSGDGDFLSNTYLANSGNLELGLRMINWLSSDDDFIAIPAAILPDTGFEISPLASGFIGLGFLVVLPAGLLLSGVLVWWRRKNL
jgi:hypothetical protein